MNTASSPLRPEAEIYIHIPFCVQKCAYCDFLSFPAGEEERERYVNALLHEIAASSGELKERPVRSVFLGGGTPTLLDSRQIVRILDMVYRCFRVRKEAEITLECNPGTADGAGLSALRDAGACRLSIGAQSFDDGLLEKIGRIHRADDIVRCVEGAEKAGFDNISLDLIRGLPGQTVQGLREDLLRAAGLGVQHLSVYSLTLEEGTPLYEERERLTFPDEDEDSRMADAVEEILSAAGYHRYEISNYARDGRECLHNTGYWTGVDYLGLGLGASSLVDGVRFKNPSGMKEYLESCGRPQEHRKEAAVLSEQDRMTEFVILGLRMTRGISPEEFRSRFGKEITRVWPGIIEKYEGFGLLRRENGRLFLTRRGLAVSNSILCEFV